MDPLYKELDPKNPAADKDGYVTRSTGRYAPNRDPGATVLGPAQWKWLAEQLKVPADLRIIGSSVQFVADDQPWEKWGNFPIEQQRFYKLIKKPGPAASSSSRRSRAEIPASTTESYPLWDITSSSPTAPCARHQDESTAIAASTTRRFQLAR
jgi:hypothetical protein